MEKNRALFVERHPELQARRDAAEARPLIDRWRPSPLPRVLMLDNAVPHMAKGAGLPRARLLVNTCAGHPFTLYPLWEFDEDWRDVYESVPATVEVMLGRGLAGLERFLEERRGTYDVLVVSRPPNLEAIAGLRRRRPDLFAGMTLVYDAEALFALREIGEAAVLGLPMSAAAAGQRLQNELALADPAARVLVVSKTDAAHYHRHGHPDVRILNHSIVARRSAPGPTGRDGLLFIGALHPRTPNEDGLVWFAEEVAPRLQALLGTTPVLTVVGACHSARIAALASDTIRLAGSQPDLRPFYDRAKVFVAPTRFAGGVPAKVIEAVAHGIPVVASDLLLRQLDWTDGKELLGAADADVFAAGIARLYLDDTLWRGLQQTGWTRNDDECDPADFARRFHAALADPPLSQSLIRSF
jgi:glycosyltransferase involved in cell wall biosynthesis